MGEELATIPSNARAMQDSYRERVEHVADLIAAGDYMGRVTAKELAVKWGVRRDTIQRYVRDATFLVKVDAGEREELRQVSIARWQRLYNDARADGDLHAAVKAQAGWDRATGVVEPVGARVQVTIGLVDAGAAVARFVQVTMPEHVSCFRAWFDAVSAGDVKAQHDPGTWVAEWRYRTVEHIVDPSV